MSPTNAAHSQFTPTSTLHPRTPFPTLQTFDIIPQIYDLLTRLPSSNPNLDSTPTPSTPTPNAEALEPKDLPLAAVPIKLKIQAAKAAVSALPDVERTVEEQEEEIRELEQRVGRLRDVLVGLGRRAGEGLDDGGQRVGKTLMEGVEHG